MLRSNGLCTKRCIKVHSLISKKNYILFDWHKIYGWLEQKAHLTFLANMPLFKVTLLFVGGSYQSNTILWHILLGSTWQRGILYRTYVTICILSYFTLLHREKQIHNKHLPYWETLTICIKNIYTMWKGMPWPLVWKSLATNWKIE